MGTLGKEVAAALSWLVRESTKKDKANLDRFGISANKAFGVSMANIQRLAKELGRSHELALELWDTGWYEARMLTAFVDEPKRVTPEQMEAWCRDFDNWGICDTLCFKLWDQTPHAWAKVSEWAAVEEEFVKRASFALLASLAGHDKKSGNERFLGGLALVEQAAADDRNFVKKGVSWALRRIGTRNPELRAAALETAGRLANRPEPAAKWIGKDALRDLKKGEAK